jgi:AAA domain
MERGGMRSPDANEILRNGSAADLRTAIDAGADDPRDRTAPPIIPRPALLSKAQFLAGYVPPDWLVDGILQRRFIYSLTAKTGDGKTAVALLIAELVAARDRRDAALGSHAVDRGAVIYFAGENPDDLRNRMIAADSKSGHDRSRDRIGIIPGTFSIDAMRAECEAKTETIGGKVDLVVVDTSAAYFSDDDENSNSQIGGHARRLRTLTTLPGGPCVLVLCHPVKNASEQSALLPRGGGAFIAEMDGNLTLWRTDEITELWHTGKLRGPGFEPMTFRLERVLCDALLDAKGRQSPTVLAVTITDSDKDDLARATRSNEDTILVAMLAQPRPIAALATTCGWVSNSGEPQKSKAHRILKGLERSGHVKKGRGEIYELTDKGKTAASIATKASAAE